MAKHRRSGKWILKEQTPPRHKRLLIPGLLALALAVGLATWWFLQKPTSVSFAAQHTGGPRLAVDRDLIDFGSVRFEKFVTARFRLRNAGDQPLRLVVDRQVEAVEGC